MIHHICRDALEMQGDQSAHWSVGPSHDGLVLVQLGDRNAQVRVALPSHMALFVARQLLAAARATLTTEEPTVP